ncbi:MAG: hypothetical protein R2856_12640 [Caldilineaceae bacterium]
MTDQIADRRSDERRLRGPRSSGGQRRHDRTHARRRDAGERRLHRRRSRPEGVGAILRGWPIGLRHRMDEHSATAKSSSRRRMAPPTSTRAINADALSLPRMPPITASTICLAHAVLDLFDIAEATPSLLRTLRDDGLCYFTINFDGITAFLPSTNRVLDDQIEELYHRSMDERITDGKPSGDHRAGRHLLVLLQEIGVDVLAAGSSDWVVHSHGGQYPFATKPTSCVTSSTSSRPPQRSSRSWMQRPSHSGCKPAATRSSAVS